MIGARVTIKRGSKEEAEKPFWISFSDLMSALMVLFLVVMAVALLAVTKRASEAEIAKAQRDREIEQIRSAIEESSLNFHGIQVEGDNIELGDIAYFTVSKYKLTAEQAIWLRTYIPSVLSVAGSSTGKKWLKSIFVEGFTDKTGDYLLNLDLSLRRSQSVLCTLLSTDPSESHLLDEAQREQVRDLFLVGGYSYNLARGTPEASRRARLRMEFYVDNKEPRETPPTGDRGPFGKCQI